MAFEVPDRAADERILEMLRLRRIMSTGEIAKRFGTTSGAVRVATNRVLDDDIARSGENRDAVVQAYGFDRQGGAARKQGWAA